MPEPSLDPRHESIKYVGASKFEGDPISFNANGGAPSRHGGSPSRYASDSDDSGKAVAVESDTGKEPVNIASSSSSSSSTVAENQDMCNNLASGSSSQHDEAEDTMDEDTTDVPEASIRSLAITPMNESGDHLYWRNREPRLLEDTHEQTNIGSGLGNHEIMRLMELPEESEHDADRHQVQEPEDLLMLHSSIVTFQVPGFSMDVADGIVPFAEWQSVEDPDDVGLENLDIFMNP